MTEFKVGDKVRYIGNNSVSDRLTIGKTYTISELHYYYTKVNGIYLIEYPGSWWYSDKFELVQEYGVMNVLPTELQPGDIFTNTEFIVQEAGPIFYETVPIKFTKFPNPFSYPIAQRILVTRPDPDITITIKKNDAEKFVIDYINFGPIAKAIKDALL